MFSKITLLLLITCIQLGKSDKPLQMVMVLFRHGARSPISTYPTDPHRDYPWNGGYNALTVIGIEQLYELGLHLRTRYEDLARPNGLYSAKNMYVVSSLFERCIMSAQALLAGFMVPPKEAINISIPWQPVAVNVLSKAEDNLIYFSRPCPMAKDQESIFHENPSEFTEWARNMTEQFEYVSQHTGMIIDSLPKLALICDILMTEAYSGLQLPEWTKELYPEKVKSFFARYQKWMYTPTRELKRLRGGVILSEFIRTMKAKRNGTLDPDRSIFLYSGHDLTQVSLLNSMEMLDQIPSIPSFGSALAFELRDRLIDSEVRMMYYDNPSVTEPRALAIPKCPSPCLLVKFEKVMAHLIVKDFDEACTVSRKKL